jgi:PhoH-like ATPase
MHCVKEILVPSYFVESLYDKRRICIETVYIPVNSCVIFRSEMNEKHTAFARHLGNGEFVLAGGTYKLGSITTRDAHQSAFAEALLNETILVNIALGAAGTGKSSLALSYAFDQYLSQKKKIILCKPAIMVGQGKAFGAVPGSFEEKYAPYLASFEIVLKKILGNKADNYLKQMIDNKDLEFIPLELTRGCTYENCTFLIDEAQNTTWPEMNTLLSRMGENSKFIALGDLNQIDIKVPLNQTGLYTIADSTPFLESPISSIVELKTQYRSAICQLATEIHLWTRKEYDK